MRITDITGLCELHESFGIEWFQIEGKHPVMLSLFRLQELMKENSTD